MASEHKDKAKIGIFYYSTWGHIEKMAAAVEKGAASTGAEVKVLRIPETLPQEILDKMHAAPKNANHPVATPDDLKQFDAVIFGIPTRYGSPAAQVKAFFDATGQLWQTGALVGKLASVFFSTSTQGGGQETTALTCFTQFVHHGMIIVPTGYSYPGTMDMKEIHGGSPYGAGTLSEPTGARQPTALELGHAEHQGKLVANYANAFKKGRS